MSPVLNAGKLRSLYAALLKCRLAMRQMHSATRSRAHAEAKLSEEAVVVGAAFDLKPEDWIVPSLQAPLAELVRANSLRNTIIRHQGANQAIPTPLLQIGMAIGLGLALQKQRRSRVALALGHIDLLDESGWKEALNLAGQRKLPLVFVIAHGAARDLRKEQQSSVVPGITVDGADVVAVYRVMQESLRRARQGHGPTMIEARLGGADPLHFMESYLQTRKLWSDIWKSRLTQKLKGELRDFPRNH